MLGVSWISPTWLCGGHRWPNKETEFLREKPAQQLILLQLHVQPFLKASFVLVWVHEGSLITSLFQNSLNARNIIGTLVRLWDGGWVLWGPYYMYIGLSLQHCSWEMWCIAVWESGDSGCMEGGAMSILKTVVLGLKVHGWSHKCYRESGEWALRWSGYVLATSIIETLAYEDCTSIIGTMMQGEGLGVLKDYWDIWLRVLWILIWFLILLNVWISLGEVRSTALFSICFFVYWDL